MNNNKRQSNSEENLAYVRKVKPEVNKLRADLFITKQHTEKSMFNDKVMEEICERSNLEIAYKKVCQNKGAPGIDNVKVEDFKEYLKENWLTIKEALLKGSYKPQAVRQVEIPKPKGKGKRTISIPCLVDRFIQQAILQVLQKKWDPRFSENSYGFRPKKSAHQAVSKAQEFVREGYKIVVDIDLENFFNQVNQDRLMSKLSEEIKDHRLLKLMRSYLQCGIMKNGLVKVSTEGVFQGGPLSPFWSNIVLDELDKELEKRGHKFCRYADDCNVYVKSKRAGLRVMKSISGFIVRKLRLKVNKEKSAVETPNKRKFLGFRLIRKPNIACRGISPESMKDFKAKVRRITKRNRSINMEERIKILSQYLRGWHAYFGFCETKSIFRDLDSWIRHRLRSVQWKQWKFYKCRKQNLINLGVNPGTAHLTAWAGKGAWRMSNMPGTRMAMSIDYFRNKGLAELASMKKHSTKLNRLATDPYGRWCGRESP
jgi:RNA-directed DNA polymerase